MGCCVEKAVAKVDLKEPKLKCIHSQQTAASLGTTNLSAFTNEVQQRKTAELQATREAPVFPKVSEAKVTEEKQVCQSTQGLRLNSIVFEMDLDEDELDEKKSEIVS